MCNASGGQIIIPNPYLEILLKSHRPANIIANAYKFTIAARSQNEEWLLYSDNIEIKVSHTFNSEFKLSNQRNLQGEETLS